MKKAKQAKRPARKVVRKPKKVARRRTPRTLFDKNDPFYLDQKLIPTGWAYQWSTYIDPRSGWRAVPYSRHAHDFPKVAQGDDGFIVIDGLHLAEIPEQFVRAELVNGAQRARDAMADFDRSLGRDCAGKGMWIMPEGWVETEEIPRSAHQNEGDPVDVAVTLVIRVPRRWNSASEFLKLSLEEYVRRRISMERSILGVVQPFATEAVFEPVNLHFSPVNTFKES